MKLSLPTAALSSLLALTGAASAQTNDDFVPERDAEFTFTVKANGIDRQIPVDCDRLDNGELTSEFLSTMGIWGHLKGIEESSLPEAQKIQHMYRHLVIHSPEFREDIPRAIEKCRTEFSDHSFD